MGCDFPRLTSGDEFLGSTQCHQGLRCVAVDNNYSICQYPGGTVTSTVVVTNTQRGGGGGATQAPAPPNPNGWSNWGEQWYVTELLTLIGLVPDGANSPTVMGRHGKAPLAAE